MCEIQDEHSRVGRISRKKKPSSILHGDMYRSITPNNPSNPESTSHNSRITIISSDEHELEKTGFSARKTQTFQKTQFPPLTPRSQKRREKQSNSASLAGKVTGNVAGKVSSELKTMLTRTAADNTGIPASYLTNNSSNPNNPSNPGSLSKNIKVPKRHIYNATPLSAAHYQSNSPSNPSNPSVSKNVSHKKQRSTHSDNPNNPHVASEGSEKTQKPDIRPYTPPVSWLPPVDNNSLNNPNQSNNPSQDISNNSDNPNHTATSGQHNNNNHHHPEGGNGIGLGRFSTTPGLSGVGERGRVAQRAAVEGSENRVNHPPMGLDRGFLQTRETQATHVNLLSGMCISIYRNSPNNPDNPDNLYKPDKPESPLCNSDKTNYYVVLFSRVVHGWLDK